MEIKWADLPSNTDYMISNCGDVMSKKTNKLLTPQKDKKGYLRISIGYNPRVTKKIHRLVAIAFIRNPNNLPQVNHKDTNKSNNYVLNLEWCDNQTNITHAKNNGLLKSPTGSDHYRAILSEKDVLDIRSKVTTKRSDLAEQYGVSIATIKDIRLRRSWTHI